jgi:hypothetical protein
MIVAVELEVCPTVRKFFELGGNVEVARPSRCLRPKEECGSLEPLRKNGTYPRQVIYWGMLFVLAILRFRCGKCGKTVSRPFGWLVPYKRYSAEMIVSSVEPYVAVEISYRQVSDVVSEPEFVEEKEDIQQTKLYGELLSKKAIVAAVTKDGGSRPSHCTVFRWVDYMCKRVESIIQQLQKELVRRQKDLWRLPREGSIENPNRLKAQTEIKAKRLDLASFVDFAAGVLVRASEKRWWQLRAYFLTQAEYCKDLLTDTGVGCQQHTLCNV